MSYEFCSRFHTVSSSAKILRCFQQCKKFENPLRFDKVTESLKVGTFFETQCRYNPVNVNCSFSGFRL